MLRTISMREGQQPGSADGSKYLRVAAIVPAYNEAERLGKVLEAIRSASLVDEIVVVDDGSTDDTYDVACRYPGVRPLSLPVNKGKGGAMFAGASSTEAEVIIFLDADLIGITGEQIDSIIRPVVERQTDVCIGVFRGGRRTTDLAQVIAPYISGQRALPRSVFLDIPGIEAVRSGVEVAMTKHFRANGLKMHTVTLTGCTHVMKEEKLGYIPGFAARLRMYYDICRITLFDAHISGKRGRVVRRLRRLIGRKDSQQG